MRILAHTRANKQKIIHKLKEIKEKEEIEIYDTESKIKETIDELIESEEIPIQKSDRGSFYERTDNGVAYWKWTSPGKEAM